RRGARQGLHGPPAAVRARLRRGEGPEPAPGRLSEEREPVEPLRAVRFESGRQQILLPVAGGRLEAFELLDQGPEASLAPEPGVRVNMLMADQEAHELLRRDGGNLPAQPLERQTVDPGEQP